MTKGNRHFRSLLAWASVVGVFVLLTGLPSTALAQSQSNDATLSALTLSDVYFGTFASGTESYTANVAYGVSQTTVTPTVNDSGATYVIKLGGVTDADGTVSLAVGSNAITVEVTAEDEQTSKTYTVTVTRAAPSTDATLEWLALSAIDIGNGLGHRDYPQTQTSFSASVYNSISQTTVTAAPNHSAASYVVKLGDAIDADGTVSLAVGSNVITVEVTAEDGQTTKTYTATVNRATSSAPTTGELSTDDPRVNFHTISYTHSFVALTLSYPRNRGIIGVVTQRYKHDGDGFVSAGSDGRYEYTSDDDLGGLNLAWTYTEPEPDTLYKWVAKMLNSQSATIIEVSLEVRTPPDPDTTTLSSDATLSDLTLSDVDFEATDRTFVGTGFHSTVTSYVGSVPNSVTETTVTPTVNHSDARYVIKLGGVTDTDGTVSLAVGSNVITVEVTAEDGETTRTYTVTVTRASPPSTDATLSALTLSGVNFGTFASGTTSYTASVASSVTQTTVTPTVNHFGAGYVIRLGGVTDSDSVISLAAGDNVITIEVTAEDGQTTRTYTVTVTRLVSLQQKSTDATLSALTLSGVNFGTFASGTESYTTGVAYSVTQTTVTPTVNDSGATYVIKLSGVTDSDGTVPLAVGSNVITVEITAEDGTTKKTYTVTVTRAAPSTDATLEWLALSAIDIGNGLGHRDYPQTQTSFSASVYNSVSQTTVTAAPNHSAASYVVKLGDAIDADGTVSLAVGSNVITVEVTAEDGQTTKTYTATVNRATSSAPTTGELSTDDPRVNFHTISYTHSFVALTLSYPRNRGIIGVVTQRYKHDGDGFVSAGSDGRYEYTSDDDLGGLNLAWTYTEPEPDTLYKWVAKMLNSQSATIIEVSLEVRTPPDPDTTTLLSDATLSDLTLSDVDFEATDRTFVGEGFHSTVTSYVGSVPNSVTETTVTPTVNHSGASYAIKLGSVTDADGAISLAVGSNVITIEVTAEDGETTRAYTVTVTRAAPSTDATLSALTLSGIDFGTFASGTTSYTASVASSVTQTTVTPTVNHFGAGYVIKLGGVTDADGTVLLAEGSNVITVEVTAEVGNTTQTYTVTVTRAEPTPIGRYDTDGDGQISKPEVIEAINDYLFGEGDEQITKEQVLEIINAYLFG